MNEVLVLLMIASGLAVVATEFNVSTSQVKGSFQTSYLADPDPIGGIGD